MFHGSMVALVTPMREDGAVDNDSLEALIEFHVAEGTDAIVAVGTTGESATIDEKEHCALLRRIVEQVNALLCCHRFADQRLALLLRLLQYRRRKHARTGTEIEYLAHVQGLPRSPVLLVVAGTGGAPVAVIVLVLVLEDAFHADELFAVRQGDQP